MGFASRGDLQARFFPATLVCVMSDPLLQAVGLTVQFAKTMAVNYLDMQVHSGELIGLIGPNGSGKTTLLRALCGLQRPSCGKVLVHGSLLENDWELLRQIGFTPDTPPVYEQLSVRDFLRFIGRGYDLPASETEERIDFWLEQLWLTEKANEPIKALSRGMRQRIGIARTMIPNPSVVLLDEPAAGLDPAGRAQFRQLLCSLREQGKAIIVSSHILADMDQYCSHIAIMSAGRLIKFGTVHAIANEHSGERCRYLMTLTRPVAGLHAQLASMDGIEKVNVDRDRVQLEYSSQREDAADLLYRLVELKLPISAFAPIALDLEEAYLRTGVKQVD